MKTNLPPNTKKDQDCRFAEIKKSIESTYVSIKKRLDSVEPQIKNQREEFIDLVRKVEIRTTKAISIDESHLLKINKSKLKIMTSRKIS